MWLCLRTGRQRISFVLCMSLQGCWCSVLFSPAAFCFTLPQLAVKLLVCSFLPPGQWLLQLVGWGSFGALLLDPHKQAMIVVSGGFCWCLSQVLIVLAFLRFTPYIHE
uniref:Uncharacterized protein n=1 Tax=Eutreptiella gymnastica TaxID=73025 RepID=A0A7S4GGW6_9EUGL